MKVLTFLVFISLIFSQIFATPFPLLAETTNISPASGLLLTDIKISLDLKGIDIIEALKIISSKGNLNMVVGGNIQGRVTLFLKDVGIQDALEIMLVSNNLAYDKRGDIFYIMTQNEYQRIYGENFGGKKEVRVMPLKHAKASDISRSLEQAKTQLGKIIVDDASNTLVLIDSPSTLVEMQDIVTQLDQPTLHRVFELKYAKVADLEAKITPLLSQGVGTLQADERTNKIAVTDTSSKIEAIGKIIRAFDEKQPQVLIEAKIIEVTLSDEYKLGVDWQDLFRSLRTDFKFSSKFAITAPGLMSPGVEAVVGEVGKTDYSMLIQALKTVGDTNILSSPRITALNNEEAKILVGESRPYATNSVVTPASGPTTTATTLTFLDLGIKLFVTPTINGDGFVTMKIKPEVSSSSETYKYGSAPQTEVPIIRTTQAETSVRVKDGTTIIIAGLIKDERNDDVSKIPMAGDVPIFGNLFKKTVKKVAKQELVILITPHIFSGEEDYLEVPPSLPIGEKKFTVSESYAFERRKPKSMDPHMFRKEVVKTPFSTGSPVASLTKVSQPATLEEYYYTIKDKILSNIQLPRGVAVPKGTLKISFRLSSKGELVSGPNVHSSSNLGLNLPALEAVKRSAPFPPFPISLSVLEKEFSIDFVFE